MDTLVLPVLQALLTCLETAVAEQPNPPENSCLRIGTQVPGDADMYGDLCCQGLAYAAMGDVWVSSNSFPEEDVVRQADSKCGVDAWGIEFRAGIMRCAPTGGDTTMPTCTEWTDAATQNVYDAKSLRRTACCFRAAVLATEMLDGMSFVVGRQVQGPVQGGCVERYVTFRVQFPNCDC